MIIVYAMWWAWTKCKRENRWQNPINLINHQHKLKHFSHAYKHTHTHPYSLMHSKKSDCIFRYVSFVFVRFKLASSVMKKNANKFHLIENSKPKWEHVLSVCVYVFVYFSLFHAHHMGTREIRYVIGCTHVLLLQVHNVKV